MSNQWPSSQFQQDQSSQGGQVKMFDPTQFQAPPAFGGTEANKSASHLSPQQQQQQQQHQKSGFPNSLQSAETAAASWNSWNSWDWKPEDNSLHQDKEDHNRHGPETNSVSQTQQFVGGVSDSGYYGNDQYSSMWNQEWSSTDHYPHSQGSSQTDLGPHYDQGHQQFAGVMFGQDQDGNDFSSPQQHSLQNQQYFDGQFYDQVQQRQHVEGDKGQAYYHEQYLGQPYDQSDSNAWPVHENGHWADGYSDQQHFSDQTCEAADMNGQQQLLGFSQRAGTESVPQNTQENIAQTPSGPNNSSERVIEAPRLEVHDDDDGTVSEFFGRDGDEDGDVQLDSQRHITSSDHNSGSEISSGVNHFLTVTPSFHRTNSEISNASLSTLNLSLGDDDDGQDPLHNIQALVQRMEEVDLAHRVSVVHSSNTRSSLLEDKTSIEQLHIGTGSTLNQGSVSDHGQKQGDYTGFSSTAVTHGHLLNSLSFDNSAGVSAADSDQPGSAGSGESGGSSGLADWEIVPPTTNLVSPDYSISADTNISVLADTPDGGVNMPSGLGKLHPEVKPPQHTPNPSVSVASDHSINDAFSSSDLTNSSSHHNTSLIMSHTESVQAYYDSRGRSGSPFIAAFTDNKEEESQFLKTQAPAQISTNTSSKFHQDFMKFQQSLPPEDGTDNSFERDSAKSLRHAGTPKHTKELPSAQSQLSTVQNTQLSENRTNSSTQPHPQRQRELTSLPAKHKLSGGSLIEDGNRINKRDFEHSIVPASSSSSAHSNKSPSTSSVHSKDSEEPPIRSSSRNSEEISASNQQRRQSAFHPVGRPRQTAMSPATTLWDNSEAPSSNILLAPAMPLIIPNLNAYSFSASNTSVNKSGTMAEGKDSTATKNDSLRPGRDSSADLSIDSRDNERKDERNRSQDSRKRSNKNRSLDSLDEIDAVVEGQRDQSYYSQQQDSRDTSFTSSRHDSYRRESDRSFSRNDRPISRNDRPVSRSDRPVSRSDRPVSRSDRPMSRSGHYHYERPLSRTEVYSREDTYRRNRGSYRDYGDSSYDERYDRPRSRQDESHSSRPSSRSGQEVEKSRGTYDRDRDHNYRDRHRAYGYDSYGRQVDYYQNERERYYRYYQEKEARIARAYYEEYYGAKHADNYYQQQLAQPQQPQQEGRIHNSQESEQSSSRSQSRGSTPATAPSPGLPPPPAIKSGPDYYGNHGSRPDSRTDYSRNYYAHSYNFANYNSYYDSYGYDPYAFGYYLPYDEYAQGQDYNQGRLTPPKYTYPHVRACFGPTGQLIKVLPNRPADGQPAVIEVQDVQTLLESCPEADDLKQFPGPLTREHTHKKDVLLFCQLKARSCAEDINMVDRESAQLIWKFLELLIKQNGAVVGTDLSDLLLEGHEPSTHEYSVHGLRISQSPEVLDTVPEGNSEDSNSARASPAVRVTSDRTVINNSVDREREKWVDRFRNLLLYGRKKDALECAMKHNLWGHALFLASKMDTRTHANVMTRFANGAIRMNDPLQTLYQLMSGRQPAAVTCVVDDRWGDWRPHLAMILSNQTSKQDLDRKSITTLGDTLAARGCLHASHFCYLMAQVNFGSYSKKTSKIVLVGSNHNFSLEEFATNEAIQCTEVYEYAQTLANPAFCLPHFQVFKYLYACRLADYGMSLEALQYCELIASNIQQYPAWFHSPFVRLVQQLASKLQFSDPQRQIAVDDAAEPVWLQQLGKMCASYDDGSIQSFSGSVTPALFAGTTTSSESGDYSAYGYGYVGDTATMNSMSGSSGIDTYRSQQQQAQDDASGYNGGHDLGVITGQVQNLSIASNDQLQPQLQHLQQQVGYSQQVDSSQQQYEYSQWQQQQQQHGYHYTDYGNQQQQQQQQESEYHQQSHSSHHEQQTQPSHHYQQSQPSHHHQSLPTQSITAPTAEEPGYGYPPTSNNVIDNISHHGDPQLDSSSTATQLAAHLHSQEYGHYEGTQQQHSSHRASISASDTYEDDDDDDDDDDDVTDGAANGFDYFGDVGKQIVAPPHRYRHMSGSSNGSTRRRRRTASESSTGSVKAAPYKPPPQQQQYSLDSGKGGVKPMRPGQQDIAGGGWFGGLFNKFKAKGKNEMILPDDKNPSIVWDPVKKKWTNADGTEDEETSAAPPPKDTDLLSKHTGAIAHPSGPPPPTGFTGGNRFSLKAKGARNQYVDVTNPKSVTVPQNLFSVMPANTISTAAPKVFLPGQTNTAANRDANNSNTDNSMLTVPASTDKSTTDSTNSTEPTTAAPSMPVLFNPASIKNTSGGKGHTSSTAGPGLKTGQRRAYPK